MLFINFSSLSFGNFLFFPYKINSVIDSRTIDRIINIYIKIVSEFGESTFIEFDNFGNILVKKSSQVAATGYKKPLNIE